MPHADPHCAFAILKKSTDISSGKQWVLRQLAVLPTCQPLKSADPKSSIARGKQLSNRAAGQILTQRRLPGNGPNTIETNQAETRAQPELTVGCLRNCLDVALGKAVSNLP